MKASTSYKKQDGALEYDETRKNVIWAPSKGGSSITLPIVTVTNLQQTPAASEKVALKVVAEAGTYTFSFTSGDRARSEQEVITATIRNAITAAKAGSPAPAKDTPTTGPETNEDGPSPAMAIAQAVRSEADSSNSWSDDKRLMANVSLQQSLFQRDPDLRKRFEQSLRDKPDSISHAQFGTQFWTSRLHLLRAHAIEKSQYKGAYNVLAELKETNVDGARKLNLTKEHIQALFNQQPIIKLIYNEVVPNRLSESEFWARFFVSKLLRKLKGERVHRDHASDAILDPYMERDEVSLRNQQLAESHVPHFIDLEGNEQNQKWKGNRQDITMIPEFEGKAPLHGILNNMSTKMLSNVDANDGQRHAPISERDNTYEELRLQDLQTEQEDDRVKLNIANQSQLFGGRSRTSKKDDQQKRRARDPELILRALSENLSRHNQREESESAKEEDVPDEKSSAGVNQVFSLIKHQRALMSKDSHISNLSADTMQSLHLTLNTTTEFLQYFWTVLQLVVAGSSNTNRKDLASLNATLGKSRDRIMAVGDEAEKQKQAQVLEAKRVAREYHERTGRKRKLDESQITLGGKKDVESLLQPTLKTLAFAQERYVAITGE